MKAIQKSVLFTLIFLMINVLCFFLKDIPLMTVFPRIVFGSLVGIWALTIDIRIVNRRMRRVLLMIAFFMMMFFWLQAIKYSLPVDFSLFSINLKRFFWYLYYLPMSALPLLSFYAALYTGKTERERLPLFYELLWLPLILMWLGFFSNDYHRLMFDFPAGWKLWEQEYTHEILYYLVVIWNIVLLTAALIIVFRRSFIMYSKRMIWVPAFYLIVSSAYLLLYFWGIAPRCGYSLIIEMPDIYCFMIFGLWEGFIQVGLITESRNYEYFFDISTTSAQIVDNFGQVIYSSFFAIPLTEEQLRSNREAMEMINKNTRLYRREISGGRVLWTDDISIINRISEELLETTEHLAGANVLLKAENELKEQSAKYQALNQIYDNIAVTVRPQIKKIEELLAEGIDEASFRQNLAYASVLNAYIKRRSNLSLIAAQSRLLALEELRLSLRESISYIRLCGIKGEIISSSEEEFAGKVLLLAYDFFEYAIEAALPTLTACMIILEAEGGDLRLRVLTDNARQLPDPEWRQSELCAFDGEIKLEGEGVSSVAIITLRGGEK